MNEAELKEAISEAISCHIPFQIPDNLDFLTVAHAVADVAAESGYVKEFPKKFKHKTWAFHMSLEHGLRWGYVRNDHKVGWMEARETTPLPERDYVIRNSDPVFGHRADLL